MSLTHPSPTMAGAESGPPFLVCAPLVVAMDDDYPYLVTEECIWPIDVPGIGTLRCGGPVPWGCPFPHHHPECPRIEVPKED